MAMAIENEVTSFSMAMAMQLTQSVTHTSSLKLLC